jgi:hypothetical protein
MAKAKKVDAAAAPDAKQAEEVKKNSPKPKAGKVTKKGKKKAAKKPKAKKATKK